MDVIFLDIDGVLNSNDTPNRSAGGFIGVEDQYLHRLNIISQCTGADIILVSDWKSEWSADILKCKIDGSYLNNRFKEHEIKIIGKTNDRSVGNDARSGRGYGIKKFLEGHTVEQYVILDDVLFSDYDEELRRHLVLTDNGLTDDDVEVAVDILAGKLLDDGYSLTERDIWKD